MSKKSFVHYYVEAQKEGSAPEIVCHLQDDGTKEYYHKFLDKKKANDIAKAEKEITPEIKFRVVKRIEIYDVGDWL